MSFYERQVLPRMLNRVCGGKAVEPLRRRVCAGLAGKVRRDRLRLGPQRAVLPGRVTEVSAVEPPT